MTPEELDHYNKLWDYYRKDLEQYQFDFDGTRSPMYGGSCLLYTSDAADE